jgi:hypothetical protein
MNSPRSGLATLLALILASVLPGAALASSPRTLRYVVLGNGTPVGSEVDVFDGHGGVESDFEFNDRGRGPKLHAHYEFGADEVPRRVAVTGVNYLKAPVHEMLESTPKGPHWTDDTGPGESAKPGFYLSQNGSGGVELAALVRVALRHPDSAVALLPGGEARVERVADAEVEAKGQHRTVTAYAVSGIDLIPAMVWIDEQGDYFGSPGRWSAVMREGWEGSNTRLYELQLKAEDERYRRWAATLARRASGPLAIEHVRVFESARAELLEDQTVVVEGSRIVAAGPASSVTVPAGAQRVDGRGRTLLPGLFDMHVHVTAIDGLLHVASGVTSVRDLGNSIEDVQHLREAWDSGDAIGPRLAAAGLVDGPGEFKAPTGIFVQTPAEVEAAVKRYAEAGDVQIKLYSSLDKALVPVAIDAAHRRGLRISGHVPEGLTAEQFVRQGADELQHINFVLLNFLAGRTGDTRTPARFTSVGEHAAEINLESPEVRDFIALLVARHTDVDVTVGAFEGMLVGRPRQVSPDFAPVLARLPASLQRSTYGGGLPVTSETDGRFREAFEVMLRMTKKLHDAGVPVLVGTDGMAGLMLHRELELHVRAGIPAAEVLRDATWVAARVLGKQQELGRIAPGMKADLLLVEGNPVERISDIRRGRLVLKDGVQYDPAALYGVLGIAPSP